MAADVDKVNLKSCEAYVPLKEIFGPGWVAALAGALSHTPKGCGFGPWLGHVQEALTLMFLSISFSLSRPFSLKSISISSGED